MSIAVKHVVTVNQLVLIVVTISNFSCHTHSDDCYTIFCNFSLVLFISVFFNLEGFVPKVPNNANKQFIALIL